MTKYLLIIILLLPQITQAIYRIYTGNIGDRKVEFYIGSFIEDDFNILSINLKDFSIESLGIPQKNNNEYVFKNYTYDTFGNKDLLTIKNLDLSENQASSKDNFLIGFSNKFGDFKLEKKFEYNLALPFNHEDKRKEKEAEKLFNNTEFKNIEFLQMNSTNEFYFKVLISKKKKEGIKTTGINIYSKKDGKLLQTIKNSKDYGFYTFFAIEVGDFDFDGNKNDFLLADSQTHATNVPQTYYIYDKSQNKFIDPNLEGYSIRFDPETRIATSTKTCGDVVNYTYNVILNKMYFFDGNKKQYYYIDQYCMASIDADNLTLRKCTNKEKQDCEKAVVEPGDEP